MKWLHLNTTCTTILSHIQGSRVIYMIPYRHDLRRLKMGIDSEEISQRDKTIFLSVIRVFSISFYSQVHFLIKHFQTRHFSRFPHRDQRIPKAEDQTKSYFNRTQHNATQHIASHHITKNNNGEYP